MSTWDKRYTDRVQLLVDILPVLSLEPRFALKGGTAINLFEHDLPRLSVDIDLTWLPAHGFAEDATAIDKALTALADTLRTQSKTMHVQPSASQGSQGSTRLIVRRGRALVQIETTPVMRGTVHPVREMDVRPVVEDAFGFASAQVLNFADLYAGKLAAALSRQHPRDLFDVGLLLDDERADKALWYTFLVYLTCSPKPACEMLEPQIPRDFEDIFQAHFKGMTAAHVAAHELLEYRKRLLMRIAEWMDEPSQAFLFSVEDEQPDFELIGLPQARELPGVKRKLQNLGRRSEDKRRADRLQLEQALTRLPPN
ncbi:nucleotidyl transferase AbiEii/AbiGii toxin family protein [Vreelandella alkaliphila]|uniref:Nucleotidyl transferase AbiEii/AbiGii toxin family protein n=1 Tax=Vreelandella alkaliphila TaxID=272774 RepID=A0A7C9K4J9_9GAMM|nr:nucleotidyl transferase AbiEii/AbiGii toxin family protein [Halomonas alkaliphila]NDL70222.1 nucleotidyl transferase AbiEii/AbiGii toxin family protein [Halomonas alkaliphila]